MARTYENMIDYVRTQMDTFSQRDVCRVDSLVFSWLSYFRLPDEAYEALSLEGLALRDVYRSEWFESMCGKLYDPASSLELLSMVAASPRFRDVRVCNYVERLDEVAEQQFSAMTFCLSPRETFVAFRGTDNTLVGWKEDFNMAFRDEIPSQGAAVRYLEGLATRVQGRLWCGGHSKGGNLAVYAGVMCEASVHERIVRCFSHDGPGFGAKIMADPRWEGSSRLIDKTIPQSSIVGMVFERQEQDYLVVHSHSSGFAQHDPFSWEVDWRDFVKDERLGKGANLFSSSVNAWLSGATDAERERFVDTVFQVLAATGEDTFAAIKANWRKAGRRMVSAVGELSEEDRRLVGGAVGDIVRSLKPSFRPHGLSRSDDRQP